MSSRGPLGKNADSQSDEFVVEKILDRRVREGKLEYYLKWEGYGSEENTWEAAADLDLPEMIREFESKRKEKDEGEENKASGSRTPTTTPTPTPTWTPKILMKKEKKQASGSLTPTSTSTSTQKISMKKEKKQSFKKKSWRLGFDRGLKAEKILGATEFGGENMFLIKWEGINEADLVQAKVAHHRCPQLVIKFYEERIVWDADVAPVNLEDKKKNK